MVTNGYRNTKAPHPLLEGVGRPAYRGLKMSIFLAVVVVGSFVAAAPTYMRMGSAPVS